MKTLHTLTAVLLLTGVGDPGVALGQEQPTKQVVVDGLRSPWSMAFLSDDRALVTEKYGELLRVDLRTGATIPVQGLPGDLIRAPAEGVPGDNSGLFDVLLHPRFDENRLLYLSYASRRDDGRALKVVRATLDGDGLHDLLTILIATPYTQGEYYHYGGGLAFGEDRKLYITTGERVFRESDEPPIPIAQDLRDLRGKVLRLNDDGSVPEDNPQFGEDPASGLYAIGIRAAQGLTRHPLDGTLWFSEHGSRQGDEINRLVAGANYGWPVRTDGAYRDRDYAPPALAERAFVAPAWSFPQTVAPTGLAFYYGMDFPGWRGDLLVPGLSRGSLWRLKMENGRAIDAVALFPEDRVRARKVALSPGGTLYLLTDLLFTVSEAGALEYTGVPNGQLIRIVPRALADRPQ